MSGSVHYMLFTGVNDKEVERGYALHQHRTLN
jgi:hypothetical protein